MLALPPYKSLWWVGTDLVSVSFALIRLVEMLSLKLIDF